MSLKEELLAKIKNKTLTMGVFNCRNVCKGITECENIEVL